MKWKLEKMRESENKKDVESVDCAYCVLKQNGITRPVIFKIFKIYLFIFLLYFSFLFY